MSDRESAASIGPYEVLGELGRGGMGVVYRVRRADLDRDFALKLVLPGGAHDAVLSKRLQREAQAAARLAGKPGVVGVHDVGEHEGALYLVMDLVAGRSLDDVIREEPPAPARAAEIGEQIARAVALAHAEGILHRDLKPGNVMLERPAPESGGLASGDAEHGAGPSLGRVRVTDFGLARIERADTDVSRLTRSEEVIGTPAYMPPEQAQGGSVDARADVYSVGATLYETIAGHPPFQADSIYGVLKQVVGEPPPPLRKVVRECPRDLERIVQQCLAKRPEDRYDSAEALAEDLARFRRGEAVLARAGGAGRRLPRAALAGVVCVAAAAGGAGWWWSSRGTAPAPAGPDVDTAREERLVVEREVQVSSGWRELTGAVAEPVNLLLAWKFGGGVTEAERQAAVQKIRSAADAVAARHPASRSPEAWRRFAGLVGEPLEETEEAARLEALQDLARQSTEDPFPAGVLALALIARYARGVDLPTPLIVSNRVVRMDYDPPPLVQDMQRQALEALDAMEAPARWEGISEGSELRDLASGAALLTRRQTKEAIPLLTRAADDPLLGSMALFLRAIALSRADQPAGSARDFTQAARARWTVAAALGSLEWIAEGLRRSMEGGEFAPPFEAALELLDLGDQAASQPGRFDLRRAAIYESWARACSARGQDPLPVQGKALQMLKRACDAHPTPTLALRYGKTLRDYARQVFNAGGDGRPHLREAIRYLDAAIDAFAKQPPPPPGTKGPGPGLQRQRAREAVGLAWAQLGAQEAARGGNWRAPYQRAIGELEQLQLDVPDRASVHLQLSRIHARLARLPGLGGAERANEWSAAAEAGRRFVDATSQDVFARLHLGEVLFGWAQYRLQERRDARALLDEALPLFDGVAKELPKRWQVLVYRSHTRRLRGLLDGDLELLRGAVADGDAALAKAPGAPFAKQAAEAARAALQNRLRELGK